MYSSIRFHKSKDDRPYITYFCKAGICLLHNLYICNYFLVCIQSRQNIYDDIGHHNFFTVLTDIHYNDLLPHILSQMTCLPLPLAAIWRCPCWGGFSSLFFLFCTEQCLRNVSLQSDIENVFKIISKLRVYFCSLMLNYTLFILWGKDNCLLENLYLWHYSLVWVQSCESIYNDIGHHKIFTLQIDIHFIR